MPAPLRNNGAVRSEDGVGHVLVLVAIVALAVLAVFALSNSDDKHAARRGVPPALSIDTKAVADATRGTVVSLEAMLPGGARATGTGVVFTSGGEVIASAHVVSSASAIQARVDGKSYDAHVVGFDDADDVAVVRLDGAPAMHVVALGDSSTLAPGTPIAIASTNGIEAGTIAAVHRDITAGDANDPNGIETLHDMVQLGAALRPGDTGAPVVDAGGRLVAVVTSATHGRRFHEQGQGLVAFATPVDRVVSVVDQIDAGQRNATVHAGPRASLGVTVGAVPGSGAGALVVNAPGNENGLATGDVIVSVGGVTITRPADVDAALRSREPGDAVKVGWVDTKGVYRTAGIVLR